MDGFLERVEWARGRGIVIVSQCVTVPIPHLTSTLTGGDNEVERAWIITRILEYARWDDIWRYLTVDDVRESWSNLRLRWPRDRELWAYALDRWTRCG